MNIKIGQPLHYKWLLLPIVSLGLLSACTPVATGESARAALLATSSKEVSLSRNETVFIKHRIDYEDPRACRVKRVKGTINHPFDGARTYYTLESKSGSKDVTEQFLIDSGTVTNSWNLRLKEVLVRCRVRFEKEKTYETYATFSLNVPQSETAPTKRVSVTLKNAEQSFEPIIFNFRLN